METLVWRTRTDDNRTGSVAKEWKRFHVFGIHCTAHQVGTDDEHSLVGSAPDKLYSRN